MTETIVSIDNEKLFGKISSLIGSAGLNLHELNFGSAGLGVQMAFELAGKIEQEELKIGAVQFIAEHYNARRHVYRRHGYDFG